jgi:hypothetical protein
MQNKVQGPGLAGRRAIYNRTHPDPLAAPSTSTAVLTCLELPQSSRINCGTVVSMELLLLHRTLSASLQQMTLAQKFNGSPTTILRLYPEASIRQY